MIQIFSAGRDGTGRGPSKVVQEVLADLKNKRKSKLIDGKKLTVHQWPGYFRGWSSRRYKEVDAGVDGSREEHQQPELLPHPQPGVQPQGEDGVLCSPGVIH